MRDDQCSMQVEKQDPRKNIGRQEPYGYVWFNRHMEQRFTHRKPHPETAEGIVGDIVPVYLGAA